MALKHLMLDAVPPATCEFTETVMFVNGLFSKVWLAPHLPAVQSPLTTLTVTFAGAW